MATFDINRQRMAMLNGGARVECGEVTQDISSTRVIVATYLTKILFGMAAGDGTNSVGRIVDASSGDASASGTIDFSFGGADTSTFTKMQYILVGW